MKQPLKIPKKSSTKQLGLIQWKIRMECPELEGLDGYKNLKHLDVFQAMELIDYMKNSNWEAAELIIKNIKELK